MRLRVYGFTGFAKSRRITEPQTEEFLAPNTLAGTNQIDVIEGQKYVNPEAYPRRDFSQGPFFMDQNYRDREKGHRCFHSEEYRQSGVVDHSAHDGIRLTGGPPYYMDPCEQSIECGHDQHGNGNGPTAPVVNVDISAPIRFPPSFAFSPAEWSGKN